jgi:hypothetical protein
MSKSFHPAWVLVLLVAVSGCKKKQKAVPSTQAKAPTISASAAPPVAEAKPEAPPATTDNPPPVVEPAPPKAKPKTKSPKKPAPAKSAPPADTTNVAKAMPPRIVVQPPSTTPESAGTVVPNMSHTEEAHHRFTTEQLIQSTDANLKSLKRVLTANEQAMMQQINAFIAQSREATQNQDLVRAHNLALKAHLLSDELVR